MNAMRVFFAIELSPEIRASLGQLAEELAPRLDAARLVPPQKIHLTLRFLGETKEDRLTRLVTRLRPEVRLSPGFELRFGGVGLFPDARRPRVLWVAVVDPPQALFDLRSLIERFVGEAGFAPEERNFAPHLTLARFRRVPRSLTPLLSDLSDRGVGHMRVAELTLFESRLSPRGASYRVIERLPLGRPEAARPGGTYPNMLL
ncbi:MAG TPA: RNA 2',3'-cyclic phosphodiesterase [Vicinamibacteria bacterium]|nr:RNA 2',3'-cyclic phosphodiesterase [Vicinamibacteria bacterium]